MRMLKLIMLAALLFSAWPGQAVAAPDEPPITFNYYGNVTFTSAPSTRTFEDFWDLTTCDLQVRYTVDLSSVEVPGDGRTPYIGVGVRDRTGLVGAMMSSAPYANQGGPYLYKLNDKHNLVTPGSRDERDYDALDANTVTARFDSTESYGIWFVRDASGFDLSRFWGFIKGRTYNTQGKYSVVITYHSINDSATRGTMFATVNNVATGFWPGAYQNAQPPLYPVGKAFTGTLSALQVSAGIGSSLPNFGEVRVQDVSAMGCLSLFHYVWLPALAK